jgi:hypothetical protein
LQPDLAMKNQALSASLLIVGGIAMAGGCTTRESAVVPASSPPSVAGTPANERVVTYPEGRYELRGDGTAVSPYYWVWIPAGANPPNPPPPPRRPRTE